MKIVFVNKGFGRTAAVQALALDPVLLLLLLWLLLRIIENEFNSITIAIRI